MNRSQNTNGSSMNDKTWSFNICASCSPSFEALMKEMESMNLIKTHRRYPCLNPPLPTASGANRRYPEARPPMAKSTAIRTAFAPIMPSAAVILVLLSPLLLGIGLWPPARAEQITLAWDYPTNELAGVTFRVKHSADITAPLTNWVTLIATTNTIAKIDVPRGVNFFTCTASNFWGESAFSNIAQTPPVVRTNVSITIERP